jgi:hypothetical protein
VQRLAKRAECDACGQSAGTDGPISWPLICDALRKQLEACRKTIDMARTQLAELDARTPYLDRGRHIQLKDRTAQIDGMSYRHTAAGARSRR